VSQMVKSVLNNPEWSVNRWMEWARSFTGRFQLHPVHQSRMSLVLHGADRGAATVSYVSHLDQFIQQISPRIYLVVSCLMREFFVKGRVIQSSGASAMPASWPSLHPILPQPAHARERDVQSGPISIAVDGGVSPMQRVFARASSIAEVNQLAVQRVKSTTLLTEACHRVVRQAFELCERVEERRSQSLVLRREERVLSTADSNAGPRDATTYSPWGPSVGKPGFAKMGPPMSIDLDRLTDQVVRQIDSKIVAHRERMGKVF